MHPKRVRQSDIASMAGVSQATVSLVLTGEPTARISEATRRRVLEAVRATGYIANPFAQGLANGRRKIVGVFAYEPVFLRGVGDFYQPFLAGIEAEAEELGCDLLLFTSAQVKDGRRQLLGEGWNRLGITDGCVLLGRHEHKGELAQLLSASFPFVFVGRRELANGVVPYVGADYVAATTDVVRMMIGHGHERIGFLGDLGPDESSVDRVTGYRAAMKQGGLSPLTLDQCEVDPQRAVDLIADNRLTAVVLGADYLAEEIRLAAAERGITVPEDVSIAILGEPERPLSGPLEWSGFRIPREDMGAQALRLLADLTDGGTKTVEPQQLLPCPIVCGETVAAPRSRHESALTRTTDGVAR